MEITLNLEKSRFESEKDGLTAVAEFTLAPGTITITHVIVPPTLRGGGVASSLAAFAIQHARGEGLKIEPRCPFMAAYMARHPETEDLLA